MAHIQTQLTNQVLHLRLAIKRGFYLSSELSSLSLYLI